jgi:hypothetical protein
MMIKVTNAISLYNIHSLAIDDILGRPVRESIEMKFGSRVEECNALYSLVATNRNLCKGFRLSKKIIFRDGVVIKENKTIECAPSTASYCQDEVLAIIQQKIASKSFVMEERGAFEDIVMTQDELWNLLLREQLVIDPVTTKKWHIKAPTDAAALPKELAQKSVLIDYIKKHSGEEFNQESFRQLFSTEDVDSLVENFKSNGLIVQVESCHGTPKINIDKLPASLTIFADVLTAWIGESEETVSREGLPLSKDKQTAGKLIWNHLVQEQIIKQPTLKFPSISQSSEEKIKTRLEEIEPQIRALSGIKGLCEKYRPAPAAAADDYKLSYSDCLSYAKANPLSSACTLTRKVFNICTFDWNNADEIADDERIACKKWLKETKEKEMLDM